MALDIARICYYADKSGKLNITKQRQNLLLLDGIIGGEGNGPLSVKGVKSGVLLFSDDVALADRIACRMMGYDYKKIPIIAKCFEEMEFPLYDNYDDANIVCNGNVIKEDCLRPVLGRPFIPPRHWPINSIV